MPEIIHVVIFRYLFFSLSEYGKPVIPLILTLLYKSDIMGGDSLLKSISIVSAIVAIISFCTLVTVAVLLFPGPYSPVVNYISDLGNSGYNPTGAIAFNAGCMIAGAFTAVFFAGLDQWRINGGRPMTGPRWLTLGRILGIFSGLMLILVGIFSEDYGKLHSIVAAVFFISIILAILVTDFALQRHPAFMKPISYYGVVVALFSALYIGTYLAGDAIIIAEWITVAGALAWMGLIAYNMAGLKNVRTRPPGVPILK